MVFDSNTLCWIDDSDVHSNRGSSDHYYAPRRVGRNMDASSYNRYESSSYLRNSAGFWQTVWGKFKYSVPVLGGMIFGLWLVYGLDWVDDKYSIVSRVKAYFSSASDEISKNESSKYCQRELEQDVPASQNSSYFIVCPVCGTQFDVTEFAQRYSAFDCDCPNVNCRRILHVENHR